MIAGEIRAEMARRRITQEEMARRLGTDQAVVSRKLRAASPFTLRDIERWAAALDIPITQLFPLVTDPDIRGTRHLAGGAA